MGLTSGCDKISPFVDEALRVTVCDRDGDGFMRSGEYCAGTDCNDGDNSILDARGWFQDVDRDTYGAGEIEYHCSQPEGYVPEGGDCDDTEELVNPAGIESCNEVDDDCDGQTDEENILTWYLDADHDTYGNPEVSQMICMQPEGYVVNTLDCDDTDNTINPDGIEVCDDEIDQDCNGLVDDADGSQLWFADVDMDSFGDPGVRFYSCEVEVEGYVLNDMDCDDADLDIHPDASEACNDGIDNDCDGEVDTDAVDTNWYRDEDGDGYGDEDQVLLDCSPPEGYVGNTGDCEDTLVDVNPLGTEICNDWLDNDCDGTSNGCDPSGEIAITDADLVFTGNAFADEFSTASCTADFNGDGTFDLVVTAPKTDIPDAFSGAVYVFLGPITSGVTAANADITIDGPPGSALLGTGLACSQDVTGNGVSDLIIEARGVGSVHIVEGASLSPGEYGIDDVATYTITVNGLTDFGIAVAPDLNSDGLGELLIGAGENDTTFTDAGAVFLILSSDLVPGEQAASTIAYATYIGEAASDALGQSISVMEDIDGDGLQDLLLGAPGNDESASNAGAVYLILSSSLTDGVQSVETATFAKFIGAASGNALGMTVFNAGDTDGDLLSEIGVGTSSAGIYLISGSTVTGGTQGVAAASVTQLTGETSGGNIGSDHFGIHGDLNSDGFSDLLIGSTSSDWVDTNAGSCYLFYGPLPTGSISVGNADLIIRGQTSFDELGNFASFSPDLNADGYDELLVSSIYSPTNKGSLEIFYGGGY